MATIAARPVTARRPLRLRRHLPATLALLPALAAVVVVYLGCMLWTLRLSFSSSKMLPTLDWVGFAQYSRLLNTDRFIASVEHILVFGVLFILGALVLGFLLAVFIDQQ